jgi:hypothetical protein
MKECIVCGFNKRVEEHHIIKRKDFGSNEDSNLVYLCPNHHWIADFGDENDKLWILEKIKDISGKEGNEISKEEKDLLFKKTRRLVEDAIGKYSDEDWKLKNIEDTQNFKVVLNFLRGLNGFDKCSAAVNKQAELLLLRDKIDEELNKLKIDLHI